MNPWELQTMAARASVDLWADAIDWVSDDEGWAWILDDMTAHLFDEIPPDVLLAAIYDGGS